MDNPARVGALEVINSTTCELSSHCQCGKDAQAINSVVYSEIIARDEGGSFGEQLKGQGL